MTLPYIEEWERILTLPWERVAAFLIAVTEDAIRLRSSLPFVGILTQQERLRIFEAFRPDESARQPANPET